MKDKCMLAAVVLGLLTAAQGVRAGADEGFGIGGILGEPTGLSMKQWISPTHAIDAAVAWSFAENEGFQFHADYLFHNFELLSPHAAAGRLPVYCGVGGRVKFKDNSNSRKRSSHDTLVGVRVPFGISYIFEDAPFDIFAEIVPILNVAPDTDIDLNAAIGIRFYFR